MEAPSGYARILLSCGAVALLASGCYTQLAVQAFDPAQSTVAEDITIVIVRPPVPPTPPPLVVIVTEESIPTTTSPSQTLPQRESGVRRDPPTGVPTGESARRPTAGNRQRP